MQAALSYKENKIREVLIMDILISGVGGQGTILASKILASAALIDGSSTARTGETIGMSQRGGCVVSHVRTEKTFSSYIPLGSEELLLSFELCEAARNIPQLKKGGSAVINTAQVNPITVSLGACTYDADTMKKYISENCNAYFIDANKIAAECGSVKSVNVVLVGAAYGLGLLDISKDALISALKKNVKPKFLDMNIKAFEAGADFAKSIS